MPSKNVPGALIQEGFLAPLGMTALSAFSGTSEAVTRNHSRVYTQSHKWPGSKLDSTSGAKALTFRVLEVAAEAATHKNHLADRLFARPSKRSVPSRNDTLARFGQAAVASFALLKIEQGFKKLSARKIGPQRFGNVYFSIGNLP